MDGILIIDKEKGITSRDVVDKAIKILNTRKIGHTGTLDPLATGVLVLCVGKYTKLCNMITSLKKTYIAEVVLGIKTDTGDITGNILEEKKVLYDVDIINNCLKSFIGEYDQEVPIYSAVKINGKKLYEYARNNVEVELPKRKVSIYGIEIVGDIKYTDNRTVFSMKVTVSKGTYIRSLIFDIATKLNTIGTMKNLRRIKQGNFSIEDSIGINDIRCDKFISIKDVLDIKKISIDGDLLKKVSNGAKIKNIYDASKVMFLNDDLVIAIYEDCGNLELKPFVMLGGVK